MRGSNESVSKEVIKKIYARCSADNATSFAVVAAAAGFTGFLLESIVIF